MKKKTKLIIGLIVACAGCCALGACSSAKGPYRDYNQNGSGVSVRFDPNGGQFAGRDGVTLVDVYPTAVAQKGVKLLEPGSSDRDTSSGSNNAVNSTATKSGYFLAGWYRERTPRTDASGNALDEKGVLCSESGNAQGYVYSGLWDFQDDKLTVASDYAYTEGEYTLTLYAAWIPYFTYTVYEETDKGWESVGIYEFNPNLTAAELHVPVWNEETGAMDYGEFPQAQNKTFTAAYSDPEKKNPVAEKLEHDGYVDFEKGVAVGLNVDCYADWKDGLWYKIKTAQQFVANSRINGCYEILADLDFKDLVWNAGLSGGSSEFSGQIIGNGHTLSNITVAQTSNSQIYGGLFGRIGATAVIENVTFKDVIYTLNAASRMGGSRFGLFSGNLNESAKIENVSVSGVLQIGNVFVPYDKYSVGLLTGNLVTSGIRYDIECEILVVKFAMKETYPHLVTVKTATGEVILSANQGDTSVKPDVKYE